MRLWHGLQYVARPFLKARLRGKSSKGLLTLHEGHWLNPSGAGNVLLLATVPLQIVDGLLYQLRVIVKGAHRSVTLKTQDPTHSSADVIMIDLCGGSFQADGTETVFCFDKRTYVLFSQSVLLTKVIVACVTV